MTPATVFVSKPRSLPTPWSSWTTWSPVRRSAKLWSARPSRASARGGRLRKTCVSGRRTRPRSREDEPAARRRDREDEAGLVRAARRPGSRTIASSAAQQRLRPLRLAAVRERDDDPVPAADVREQVSLGLGEARGQRPPAAAPRTRAAGRPGAGSAERAAERRACRRAPRARPARTSSASQTRSGAAERRDEVVRAAARPPLRPRASARRGRARRSAAG